MTPETCHGCAFHKRIIDKDFCTRARTMKSGLRFISKTECKRETTKGFDMDRADGDFCGPSRRHFKAGSVM